MKNLLIKLFKESRVLFYVRVGGPAPSAAPGAAPEDAPRAPSKARLDTSRAQVLTSAQSSRRGDIMPDKYVKAGKENWGTFQTEKGTAIEQWAEDLDGKCNELEELATEVIRNSTQHTQGFVAKAQEILAKARKIKEEVEGDANSWWGGSDLSVGQMNNRQDDIDNFEAALKGESGSGAAERAENTALLATEMSSQEGILTLDRQVVLDANALKALQPKELGTKFAADFYGYYGKACLPLIEKAKTALKSAMGKGTNVEIHRYIAEAQFNIDQADQLAGTYITNIDQYHEGLKPTLENEEYKGKFGKMVMADFVKDSVKVFDKADKTKEGALAPEAAALVEKWDPKFALAVEAEALLKEEGFKGPKGKKLAALFEKELEVILKKKYKTVEELEKDAEPLIGGYAEKVKAAQEFDNIRKNPNYKKGKESDLVVASADKEIETLFGKKRMSSQEAAQEVDRLITGWNAKLELARELDNMSTKREYSGREAQGVLKKFIAELEPGLKGPCNDPDALRKSATELFEKYKKDFQLAYIADQLNNKYTIGDISQALPDLNNPMIDPNSQTGKVLNDIRKYPQILDAATGYLEIIGVKKTAAPVPAATAAKPQRRAARRSGGGGGGAPAAADTTKPAPAQPSGSQAVEQPGETARVDSPDIIKIGEGKFAARNTKPDENGTPVYVDGDGKTYTIKGRGFIPAGRLDTKEAQTRAKGYKQNPTAPKPKPGAPEAKE